MRRRDQRGSTLVIALAVTGALGITVPAALGLAFAGANSNIAATTDRADTYAATSGIEAAIAYAGRTEWVGRFGAPCPTIAADVGATPVEVTCASTTGPTDVDRTLTLTARVGGRIAARAAVLIRDSAPVGGAPRVDVLTWDARPGEALSTSAAASSGGP